MMLNVVVTPAGGVESTFARVDGASACGLSVAAWYYDNPDNPKSVLFCPSACDSFRDGSQLSAFDVKVLFGCQGVTGDLCQSTVDCLSALLPACDQSGLCLECTTDGDCGGGTSCRGGQCAP